MGRASLFAAAVLWAGMAEAARPEPPKGAEGGKRIFESVCAPCHGSDARGDGPVADSLKTKPADLRQIARRRGGSFPQGEVARHIDGRETTAAHGTREMPVWGDTLASAVPDEPERERRIARAIEMLVAYLEKIQE